MILMLNNVGLKADKIETIRVIDFLEHSCDGWCYFNVVCNEPYILIKRYKFYVSFDGYKVEIDESKYYKFNGDFRILIEKLWDEVNQETKTLDLVKTVNYCIDEAIEEMEKTDLSINEELRLENELLKKQLNNLKKQKNEYI